MCFIDTAVQGTMFMLKIIMATIQQDLKSGAIIAISDECQQC
jgi:hypothetical protein